MSYEPNYPLAEQTIRDWLDYPPDVTPEALKQALIDAIVALNFTMAMKDRVLLD